MIIGEKEQESGTISIRKKGEGNVGSMTLDEFKQYFSKIISDSLGTFEV